MQECIDMDQNHPENVLVNALVTSLDQCAIDKFNLQTDRIITFSILEFVMKTAREIDTVDSYSHRQLCGRRSRLCQSLHRRGTQERARSRHIRPWSADSDEPDYELVSRLSAPMRYLFRGKDAGHAPR